MITFDLDSINRIVVSLGLPTIVAGLIYTGRKLQILDHLERIIEKELRPELKAASGQLQRLGDLGRVIDQEIRPDLKDVRERFAALEGKFTEYTASLSPISLTAKGEKLLRESGLKEYIDTHRKELLEACRGRFPMDTAYDIQEAAFEYFGDLEFSPELEKQMKQAVYEDGTNLDIVRRLGAIYFRDICLVHFNKDAKEIDEYRAEQASGELEG